jgi:hypothetical protein
MRRWRAAGVLLVVLGVAGWFGYRALNRDDGRGSQVVASQDIAPIEPGSTETIETVTSADDVAPAGGTPMAQRIAVVGLLNKRNGESRELTLKPGQAVRVGDAIVRLRACEHTAPWEQEQLTGAFVQLDVRGIDRHWRRSFSGWLYKERPGLNVVPNAIYDVWTKSCTMSWPATGPDTVAADAGAAPANRSSARKSPAADAEPTAEPTTPSSAAESNAT